MFGEQTFAQLRTGLSPLGAVSALRTDEIHIDDLSPKQRYLLGPRFQEDGEKELVKTILPPPD